MKWTVGQARQRFSELLRDALGEPQIITNRDRPVAAVVDGETFRQFEEWRARRRTNLDQCFQELRQICAEEDAEIVVPKRSTRQNSFPEVIDELSGRHERP